MAALLTAFPAGAAAPGPPTHLRCEYAENPLGIDEPTPRLSWWVNDDRRGAVQTAYQVLVASSVADLDDRAQRWDTGKVESDQSVSVTVDGLRLVSRGSYYWKVRTWDQFAEPSPWSRPASFEMGILDTSEWNTVHEETDAANRREYAPWITMADAAGAAPMGQWIWHPTEQGAASHVILRGRFTLGDAVEISKAEVLCAADNHLTLYLNGQEIGKHDTWETLATFDVMDAIGPGENVVVIEAANDDGPCGAVASLRISDGQGGTVSFGTGGTWHAATGDVAGDWTDPDFDDSSWPEAAVIADYGAEPWGRHDGGDRRAVYVRKEFEAKPAVRRARVYVTGLGLYRLFLNGQRVGEDELTPGWTHYDKRVQYQTYDVTRLVREGPNALGASLGSGWWSGRINWRRPPEGTTLAPRLLLKLVVDYDGFTEIIHTDPSWKAHTSPVLANDLYDGETHDARLDLPGWSEPGFDDSGWAGTRIVDEPLGRLVAQADPPIRVTETLPVQEISQPADGVYVFDFGQNAAGWARLTVHGAEPGQEIRIRFAEELKPDGQIYTDNYRSAKATDVYMCRGEAVEVWEPSFTYRGFRYAELTGYPGEPPKDALAMRVAHTAPEWTGEFACSNDLINRVQQNLRWGLRSNLHSVPTDCPQRDERLGWTGDALIFMSTACWNMDLSGFLRKWLRDITDSQGPNGEVSDVAPQAAPHGPASPGWGDVIATAPWQAYLMYGDRRILEENYDGTKAWVELMRRSAPNLLYEREGYGDWVAVVGSPKKPIGAAFFYRSTDLLAQMAEVLGHEGDAREYADLARGIGDAFNNAYLDRETNTYPGGTQTAQLLPLAFGIVPEDRRQAVAQVIAEDVRARDEHLSTGFLGTPHLLPMLTEYGYHDLAYRLADQRTYPSWGYMVEKGATTIWELWNSDTQGPGMNSRNHYAYGSVGEWYFQALAGINPDPEAPGFRRFSIRPHPVEGLTWVRASFPSVYGVIRSEWKREDDRLTLQVTIPPSTSARIYIPTPGTTTPSITESGREIARDGEGSARAEGLRFRDVADGAAVFEAQAGTYSFAVTGR